MPIKKVRITNFKHFKDTFTIELDEGVNILVGKNGEGKSTILEAINLALTGFYHGRAVSRELSQYLFNTDADGQESPARYLAPVASLSEVIART